MAAVCVLDDGSVSQDDSAAAVLLLIVACEGLERLEALLLVEEGDDVLRFPPLERVGNDGEVGNVTEEEVAAILDEDEDATSRLPLLLFGGIFNILYIRSFRLFFNLFVLLQCYTVFFLDVR